MIVAIAGAGQAAAQSVLSLRHVGFMGKIVLIGEEPYLPYQRPPLSKAFMTGKQDIKDFISKTSLENMLIVGPLCMKCLHL